MLKPKKNDAVKVAVEGEEFVIRLPFNKEPVTSASGKSLVVSSTGGNVAVDFQGKELTLLVNAYFPKT